MNNSTLMAMVAMSLVTGGTAPPARVQYESAPQSRKAAQEALEKAQAKRLRRKQRNRANSARQIAGQLQPMFKDSEVLEIPRFLRKGDD
jgi:hypothetical protein